MCVKAFWQSEEPSITPQLWALRCSWNLTIFSFECSSFFYYVISLLTNISRDIENTGKWSEISVTNKPFMVLWRSITFENILSINVIDSCWILIGLVISGNILWAYIMSMKSLHGSSMWSAIQKVNIKVPPVKSRIYSQV